MVEIGSGQIMQRFFLMVNVVEGSFIKKCSAFFKWLLMGYYWLDLRASWGPSS
jgi:hypothetical protein